MIYWISILTVFSLVGGTILNQNDWTGRQSGTYNKQGAQLALEGKCSVSCLKCSSSYDSSMKFAWLQIDMKRFYFVTGISFTSKIGSIDYKYVENFVVMVRGDNKTSDPLGNFELCVSFNNKSYINPGSLFNFNCSKKILGRFLTIKRQGGFNPESLSLCKLKVRGEEHQEETTLITQHTYSQNLFSSPQSSYIENLTLFQNTPVVEKQKLTRKEIIGIALGCVFAFLILLSLFIFLVCFICCKRKIGKKNHLEKKIKKKNQTIPPIQSCLLEPNELVKYVNHLNAGGIYNYIKEFQTFPEDEQASVFIASNEENKNKNAFINSLPYDHNRVILDGKDNYVNATFIQNNFNPLPIIISPRPLPSTIGDYWKMVKEQKVKTIVSFVEKDEYLSLKGMFSDQIEEAILVDRDDCTLYSKESYIMSKSQNKFPIINYIIKGNETNIRSFELLSLIEMIKPSPGSLYVQCRSGLGMTGVFVGCWLLLDQLLKEKAVDVDGYVKDLRFQRSNIVQNVEQYKLIYEVLKEKIILGDSSISVKNWEASLGKWKRMKKRGKNEIQNIFLKLNLLLESEVPPNLPPPSQILIDTYKRPQGCLILPTPLSLEYIESWWTQLINLNCGVCIFIDNLNINLCPLDIRGSLVFGDIEVECEDLTVYQYIRSSLCRLTTPRNESINIRLIQLMAPCDLLEERYPREVIDLFSLSFSFPSNLAISYCKDIEKALLLGTSFHMLEKMMVEGRCDIANSYRHANKQFPWFRINETQFALLYLIATEYIDSICERGKKGEGLGNSYGTLANSKTHLTNPNLNEKKDSEV